MKKHWLIASAIIVILLISAISVFSRGVKSYAAQQGFVIASGGTDDFSDLQPLIPAAKENVIFMYGESHGIAENEMMVFRLLKFLHRNAGYRYLALESDFAYTYLVNEYLKTGDETYLLKMDKWYYNNASRTKESYQFFRDLYLFNKSLPEGEKITVWCTDVAHGVKYTLRRIGQVIETVESEENRFHLTALFKELEEKGEGGLNYKDTAEFEEKCREIIGNSPEGEELLLLVRSLRDVYGWRRSEEHPEEFSNGQDIRERSMLSYYDYFFGKYNPEKTGRVFAYNGSAHIRKGVAPKDSKEVLGIFLNEQFKPTQGKVFSLYAAPVSGKARDGQGKVRRAQGLSFGLRLIARLLPSRFTLFFTEELSQLSAESKILELKTNTTEINKVYDAVLIMKDVTPETGLELQK